MSNKNTKAMEATTIAHMVGRMDAILKMVEFDILRINGNEYLVEFLRDQIKQAKDINERIFEMHLKNELEKIKKTYSNESDENE